MPDKILFALLFGAIIIGITLERWRARWARNEWRATRAGAKFPLKPRLVPPPITDASDQLRIVMSASFEKRRILSKAEARVFYAIEAAIKKTDMPWRVMAQVSLGEILASPDARAYGAINSKRVDLLVIGNDGIPIAAIEYQGSGHYQGSAPARDAVKKEALRKAGIRYVEVTTEHDVEDIAREISRIAKVEQMKSSRAETQS